MGICGAGASVLDEGNRVYKGPAAEAKLVCSRKAREVCEAGAK